MEIWKNIDGYEGYQISSYGRIRSFYDYRGHISNKSHILRPRINPNGYEVVCLYINGIPHQLSVHRLVAKTFIPNDDDTLVIDHLDMNKRNNCVDNLEWVTVKENSLRAFHAGLYENSYRVTRRPVMITDLRNGEQTYYKGLNEAAREIGYSASILSRVANMITDRVGYYAVEFADNEDRLLYGLDDYYI